jgi:hypothetical protein
VAERQPAKSGGVSATEAPIERAVQLVLGAYLAARRLLRTPAERDVLRDVIACALARDYLAEMELDERKERAA